MSLIPRQQQHDPVVFSRRARPQFQVAPPPSQKSSRFLFVAVDEEQAKQRFQKNARSNKDRQKLRSHVQFVTMEAKRRQSKDATKEEESEVDRMIKHVLFIADQVTSVWSMNAHLADPFDSLPVKGGAAVNELVLSWLRDYPGGTPRSDDSLLLSGARHHRRQPNLENTVWSLIYRERVSFLLLLWGVTCLRDMTRAEAITSAVFSRDFYTYMNLLMKEIREVLSASKDPAQISESYVTTVGSLAAGCVVYGNNAAALHHLNGCKAIIAARGGLRTFRHFTQRTLLWVEYHVCSANVIPPTLRIQDGPEPYMLGELALPASYQQRVRAAHRRTLALVQPAVLPTSELSGILKQLHQVGLEEEGGGAVGDDFVVDRDAVSAIMDDAERRVTVELVRLKSLEEAAGGFEHDPVYAVFAWTAQTYIWRVLHEGKQEMAMKTTFMKNVRDRLEMYGLIEAWQERTRGAALEALVWILAVNLRMAALQRNFAKGMEAWFEEKILYMTRRMQIEDEGMLRGILQGMPCTEEFVVETCAHWRKLVNRSSPA